MVENSKVGISHSDGTCLNVSDLRPRTQIVTKSDGSLVPLTARLTPTEIVGMLNDALLSPYTGKDPNKKKLTKGAAAFQALAEAAQDGDQGAFSFLLDRLIGKPVQQVNSLNVTASLSEFLSGLAAEMEKDVIDVEKEVDPFGD